MYFDSAYIAKYYLNEPDSSRVRALIPNSDDVLSSMLALAEVTCVFHRKLREKWLDSSQYQDLRQQFLEDVQAGLWTFVPITERLLRTMALLMNTLPASTYVRSGDAIHLTTALDLAEPEIWTSDRHVLVAASHFGLRGRSA